MSKLDLYDDPMALVISMSRLVSCHLHVLILIDKVVSHNIHDCQQYVVSPIEDYLDVRVILLSQTVISDFHC